LPSRTPDIENVRILQSDVLLVCAYEDDEKCKRTGVDGKMTLTAFRDKLADIARTRVIVFCCA
jgi:hypothetical protein